MIYSFRANTYTRNIYYFGTERLDNIPSEYYAAVEQRASDIYTVEQLQAALNNGWITQTQYDETVALKTTV